MKYDFKKMIKLFLLPISICCISCDCMITVDGSVRDKSTKGLISDVEIYSLNKTYTVIKTDSNGEFKFSEINGGAGKCSSIDLVFSKKGFKTDTITFKSGSKGVLVELEK